MALRIAGALLLFALASSGCNKDQGRPNVQGKISLNGAPVRAGTLHFRSEGDEADSFSHRIPLRPDGTFSGEVPAPGNYKIAIEESLAVQEGKPADKSAQAIPAKYKDTSTSGLTWTIMNGENKRDFELTE